MKVLILLLGLVAYTAASSCGPLERIKVKTQWNHAFGTGHHREDLGLALWKAVFALAPESRDLFHRVNGEDVHSPEFHAHSIRVLGGLDIAISLLDNEEVLNDELAHLRVQHAERHLSHSHFETFKHALMEVIPATLGRCFDHDAWSHCYDVIAHGIHP